MISHLLEAAHNWHEECEKNVFKKKWFLKIRVPAVLPIIDNALSLLQKSGGGQFVSMNLKQHGPFQARWPSEMLTVRCQMLRCNFPLWRSQTNEPKSPCGRC